MQHTSPSKKDKESHDKGTEREVEHDDTQFRSVLAQCDAAQENDTANSKEMENVGYAQDKSNQAIKNHVSSQNAAPRENTSEGESGVEATPGIDGVRSDNACGLYSCPQCGRTFKTLHTYKVHMSMPTHTSARPFVCRICGKGFRLSSTLSRHKVIHTDERPHKCQVCDKSFNRSSTLNAHMKTHKNCEPYCCNICGHEFDDRNRFINHVVSHSTGKPGHFVKQGFSSHFDALIEQYRQFYLDSYYRQFNYNTYHHVPVMYYL